MLSKILGYLLAGLAIGYIIYGIVGIVTDLKDIYQMLKKK
jgi:Kef-type K+ transport system membrane component KefB